MQGDVAHHSVNDILHDRNKYFLQKFTCERMNMTKPITNRCKETFAPSIPVINAAKPGVTVQISQQMKKKNQLKN